MLNFKISSSSRYIVVQPTSVMYTKLAISALALLCASGASAQFERCHTNIMTPHHFLDFDQFLGVWYPLEVHFSKTHQAERPSYACNNANFTPTDTPDHYNQHNQGRLLQDGELGPAFGDHLVIVNGASTDFTLKLPSKWYITEDRNVFGQSTIVAADESFWALQYVCLFEGWASDGTAIINEKMLLLSRERTMDPTVRDTLHSIIYAIGFQRENGFQIIQSGCN